MLIMIISNIKLYWCIPMLRIELAVHYIQGWRKLFKTGKAKLDPEPEDYSIKCVRGR